MTKKVNIVIDGKKYEATENVSIVAAAKENRIYVPTLCFTFEREHAPGACRICTVKINGRNAAACTSLVQANMEIEVNTPELVELRKVLIEMLFVEGNHFCPSCEKSGDCELQALAYRHEMFAPRFPYEFSKKEVDYFAQGIIKEHNRCIMCHRCVEDFQDEQGRNFFAHFGRSKNSQVHVDKLISKTISDDLALKMMENCPVGAILKRGKGFDRPVGTRKYDKRAIGSEIERDRE